MSAKENEIEVIYKLPYLFKYKTRFFPLKFGTSVCDVFLSLRVKCQTKACMPNHHVSSALFWNMQCMVVIPYRHMGQPISPIFKGQEIEKRAHCTPQFNWHSFLFRDFVHCRIF